MEDSAQVSASDTMSSDDAMEMPCHKTEMNADAVSDVGQDKAGCDNCDCQHCVKISLIPATLKLPHEMISKAALLEVTSLYSANPSVLFHPPKLLS